MAKIECHYGNFRVRWTDENGIRNSRTFDTRLDADYFISRETLRVKEAKKGLSPTLMLNKTFDDLIDYWIKHRSSQKRNPKDDLSIINCHLRPYFGGLKLHQLSVLRIDSFKLSKENLSKKTLHNILTLFISMLRQAKDLGWLIEIPKVKKPSIILNDCDFFYLRTDQEINELLCYAKERSYLHYIFYKTAIYTGLRVGEAAALTRSDIDFQKRLITVSKSYDQKTKNGRTRVVPLLDVLFFDLQDWFSQNPLFYVFPNKNGDYFKSSSQIFQEDLKLILAKCINIQDRNQITFHDFRHTFASQWMMKGGDIYKLKSILGHQDIAMTQRYAHLSPHIFQEDHSIFGTPQISEKIKLLPTFNPYCRNST